MILEFGEQIQSETSWIQNALVEFKIGSILNSHTTFALFLLFHSKCLSLIWKFWIGMLIFAHFVFSIHFCIQFQIHGLLFIFIPFPSLLLLFLLDFSWISCLSLFLFFSFLWVPSLFLNMVSHSFYLSYWVCFNFTFFFFSLLSFHSR